MRPAVKFGLPAIEALLLALAFLSKDVKGGGVGVSTVRASAAFLVVAHAVEYVYTVQRLLAGSHPGRQKLPIAAALRTSFPVVVYGRFAMIKLLGRGASRRA